jgi:hypothetical protein
MAFLKCCSPDDFPHLFACVCLFCPITHSYPSIKLYNLLRNASEIISFHVSVERYILVCQALCILVCAELHVHVI